MTNNMLKQTHPAESPIASSAYENYTKEQLILELNRIKKKKKFGLVWEDKPEEVSETCKVKLPVLLEAPDKEITNNPNTPTNVMIEGDNYLALSVLNYTHKGKIDIIYIDPPYNTGAKDWKYNNAFVDINDAYRHSKWLAFMDKRLRLAKNLLKKTGVLICTIDHNEQENLGILLGEIFFDYEITCVTIIHNPAGVQGINFSYTHEYAYFVYPKNGKFITNTTRENDLVSPLRDWGTISKRNQAKNCFYPIIIKNEKIIGFGDVCQDSYHPKSANLHQKNGEIHIYPIDSHGIERKWVFSRPSVVDIKDQLFVKQIKKEFVIMRRKNDFVRRTVWDDKRYYANIYGSKLLNQLIDIKFPFPKSLYAVEDCLTSVAHNKDNAIILDFFAGSGTTGHAVLKMNKDDKGNRQFILCTNNENKIAEEVCYPRIKKVIKGHKEYLDITGIPSNLKYFRTGFVDAEPTDKNKKQLTTQASEMLCLKEGTFEKVLDKKAFKIYKNAKHYMGIIFDPMAIPEFKKHITEINGKFSVYVFSLGDDSFEDEFQDIEKKVTLSPIPEAILRIYRRIFK